MIMPLALPSWTARRKRASDAWMARFVPIRSSLSPRATRYVLWGATPAGCRLGRGYRVDVAPQNLRFGVLLVYGNAEARSPSLQARQALQNAQSTRFDSPGTQRRHSAMTTQTADISPSGQIEPIEIHDLRPRSDEVLHELAVRIGAAVHLGQSPQLRVRAEDEIDAGARPFERARCTIAPFEEVLCVQHRLPFGAHVEEVHEEIVGERLHRRRRGAH